MYILQNVCNYFGGGAEKPVEDVVIEMENYVDNTDAELPEGVERCDSSDEDDWEVIEKEQPKAPTVIDNTQNELPAGWECYDDDEEKRAQSRIYKDYLIEETKDPNFPRYFALHKILWNSSPTYKQLWTTIVDESKQLLRITSTDSFGFEAFADINNERLGVVINNSLNMEDYMVGTLIAFELTNISQRQRFYDIDANARAGHYRRHHGDRAAISYAWDKEQIENIAGKDLHNVMISEAIENSNGQVTEKWRRFHEDHGRKFRYEKFVRYVNAQENEKHIQHYVDDYHRAFEQHLPGFSSEAMKKRAFEMNLRKDEPEGEYRKVDGKWVKAAA